MPVHDEPGVDPDDLDHADEDDDTPVPRVRTPRPALGASRRADASYRAESETRSSGAAGRGAADPRSRAPSAAASSESAERIAAAREAMARLVRDVPDFPEPGIVFKDITPLLADHDGFRAVVDGARGGAVATSTVRSSSTR